MNLKVGLQEYTVDIKQHKINCQCEFNLDSQEVIMFFHGLACSRESFRNVFDKQYFPNKSLLLIDFVGFGKSSKSEDFSYSMEDQADVLEELLSLLPPWQIHIVAHSMGGAIALLFSQKTLSRICSFTNIEGNLISEDCGLLSRGIASVPYNEYKTGMFNTQRVEWKGHHQLRFEQTDPTAVYKSAKSLIQWSESGKLLAKFKALTCKKSYFWGEENCSMPILKKLDFVKTYMIHNSGHGMMTENPKEFYTKLVEFIDSKVIHLENI
jgi:pimeloyl-ACP methyl ester carboxylesterase